MSGDQSTTSSGAPSPDLERQFWEASAKSWSRDGDHSAPIAEAGRQWIGRGCWLAGIIAMEHAIDAAWGQSPEGTVDSFAADALDAALTLERKGDPGSPEVILGLHVAQLVTGRMTPTGQFSDRRNIGKELALAQAEHLKFAAERDHAGHYLVLGTVMAYRLAGPLEVWFPPDVIDPGGLYGWRAPIVHFQVAGAFHTLIAAEDYEGALRIATTHADLFTTPTLKGWRHAAAGMVSPGAARTEFTAAADIFAADTHDAPRPEGRGWSGANSQLWAPYFRARALLVEMADRPEHAIELLKQAADTLEPTRSGFFSVEVQRLRVLVGALADLLTDGDCSMESVEKDLSLGAAISGSDPEDGIIWHFLQLVRAGLAGYRDAPEKAVFAAHLATAAVLLNQLPLLAGGPASTLQRQIGIKAVQQVAPAPRTWIQRTLEGVEDERKLHRLLLELFREQFPLFSHILHGPVEYGKDLVVVRREGERAVLRMYQAKVGSVTLKSWPGIAAQLEMMFQVPFTPAGLAGPIDERIGVLVITGHVDPHANPVVGGWIEQQRRAHGRTYEVLDIDGLASMVVERRSYRLFRRACEQNGIVMAE